MHEHRQAEQQRTHPYISNTYILGEWLVCGTNRDSITKNTQMQCSMYAMLIHLHVFHSHRCVCALRALLTDRTNDQQLNENMCVMRKIAKTRKTPQTMDDLE